MSSSNKKYQLDQNTNICELNVKCIESISGINADSASPTDVWLIKFNKNTFYNQEKINNGFLKIYISPKTIGKVQNELDALDYEINIYKDIIKPLIDYNVCSNFIKYLASGIECTYDNLLRLLEHHIFNGSESVKKIIVKQLLNRNINCIKKRCSQRVAINNIHINILCEQTAHPVVLNRDAFLCSVCSAAV